jgi:glutathione synthase/RimK-type ligase-like ATP-grasp enzyme
MNIAIVSASGVNVQEIDDRWLLTALTDRGMRPTVVRWDDPDVGWPAFDAVWLRSCWDYHRRYAEFVAWLRRADAAGTRFVTDASLVLRNSHKRYLLQLQDAGVPVPRLELARQGEAFDTIGFLESARRAGQDWPDVVIKPAVSASAYRTFRASAVTREDAAARVQEILADGDAILQCFVPEIGTHGEWSLVFIDGGLSHAVRRLPPSGEFRSQLEFGAKLTVETPPAAMQAIALRALSVISGRDNDLPCIARIDLVDTPTGPVLMEVELIEPVLYFGQVSGAADRAIDAIARRLAQSPTTAATPLSATAR